jgi:hypothetical protein
LQEAAMKAPRVLLFAVMMMPWMARAAEPATPAGKYYITIFGSWSEPYKLKYCHTWATAVHIYPDATGAMIADMHTNSWMPASLQVRPFALKPEPGVNLTLDATLAWVKSYDGRVGIWGPYEITADTYVKFVERKDLMDSGTMLYRASGGYTRYGNINNCGQSYTRNMPNIGRVHIQPTPAPGHFGTERLVERMVRSSLIVKPESSHPEVLRIIHSSLADVSPMPTPTPWITFSR